MSNFRIDIRIDTEDLEDELEGVVEGWDDHRSAVQLAIGERLVGSIKRELTDNTNTGRLMQSVRHVETSDPSVSHVMAGEAGVDYALPLLHGTDPHGPGSPDPSQNRALDRWARRNGYPGGFESIYWSIYRYGTEAHDYLSEPLDETQREAGGIAAAILKQRGVLR